MAETLRAAVDVGGDEDGVEFAVLRQHLRLLTAPRRRGETVADREAKLLDDTSLANELEALLDVYDRQRRRLAEVEVSPAAGEGRAPRELVDLANELHAGLGHKLDRELKVWPLYFDDIVSGAKTWEVLRDDAKGFGAGCWIRLREWDPERGRYTGREVDRFVTYVASLHRIPGMEGLVGMTLAAEPKLLPSAPVEGGERDRFPGVSRPASRARLALTKAVLVALEAGLEPATIRRVVEDDMTAALNPFPAAPVETGDGTREDCGCSKALVGRHPPDCPCPCHRSSGEGSAPLPGDAGGTREGER